MTRNPNHPKPGSIIKVEPIRRPEDIERIRVALKDKPRDLCLFNLGVNTNLRSIDLVNLKVAQVRNLQCGDILSLRESKTQKRRDIFLNQLCIDSIQLLLRTMNMKRAKDEDFLFQSRKGRNRMLLPNTITALVKKWVKDIGLDPKAFGSNSMRKSFGFHHRRLGADIPSLMLIFNHSTQRQTLTYLGISEVEIKQIYLKEI